jgi:hypothetical protein
MTDRAVEGGGVFAIEVSEAFLDLLVQFGTFDHVHAVELGFEGVYQGNIGAGEGLVEAAVLALVAVLEVVENGAAADFGGPMAIVFEVALLEFALAGGFPEFGAGGLVGIFPGVGSVAGLFAGNLDGDFTIEEGFEEDFVGMLRLGHHKAAFG